MDVCSRYEREREIERVREGVDGIHELYEPQLTHRYRIVNPYTRTYAYERTRAEHAVLALCSRVFTQLLMLPCSRSGIQNGNDKVGHDGRGDYTRE